jgi:hypothetical protein
MINFIKRSLQLELNSFTDLLENPDVTKQAFSKARKKLSPIVFKSLNEKLIIESYSDNDITTFKGYRLLGVDGSTVRLPISDELYKEYGSDVTNNSIPLARTSIMHDVLNNITIHATLNSYHSSERDMALEHIFELCRITPLINGNYIDDILIFDRGYPSLFIIFLLMHLKKHFVMRCSKSFLAEVNAVLETGTIDTIITIPAFKQGRTPSPNFAKYLPHLKQDASVQVRITCFDLSSGEQEILISSLVNQDQFTYDDLFKLYGMRWGAEEGYKLYKCIAEIENFSGKSKLTVEQDFFATIFTCNVAGLLMQEAQTEVEQEHSEAEKPNNATVKIKQRKYVYKINRNVLIGTLKNEIVEIFLNDTDLNAYCEQFKKRIKRSLVPIRPGRSYPRIFRGREKSVNRRAL